MQPQGAKRIANAEKAPDAQTLRQVMEEAYAALQTAHLGHERALETLPHIDHITAEDLACIQKQGRDYASAVTRYCHAVMVWLGFIESGTNVIGQSLGRPDRS
jgi:hypothetical protein